MDRKLIIAIVVTAVVFGAAGFGGGMLLGRTSGGTRLTGANAQFRMGQNGQNRSGNGMAVGKVTEVDKDSFTVKSADGSTRVVYVSGSTQISKTETATVADISVDTTVSAFGTATSGGDITAQRVQIGNLAGIMGGFRGAVPNAGRNGGGQSGQGNRMMPPDGGGIAVPAP